MDPKLLQKHIDTQGSYPYQKEYDLILEFINDIVPDKKYKSLSDFKRVSSKLFDDEKRSTEIYKKYDSKFSDMFDINIEDNRDLSDTLRKVLDKISYKLTGRKNQSDMLFTISMK